MKHSINDSVSATMTKPRPGVAASKRLAKCKDESVWIAVEEQYDTVKTFLKKGFDEIEKNYEKVGRDWEIDALTFTKDQLLDVVAWKFAVGKPRNALLKHLHSNTETSVQEHSLGAMTQACHKTNDVDIEKCIKECTKLKGVGPATASALLTLVNPSTFAYMYDEVIDCFLPKRTYTLPTYLAMNQDCMRIAESLGKEWTASRVARVLWVAARSHAYDLDDHTLKRKKSPLKESSNTESRARKRQKR